MKNSSFSGDKNNKIEDSFIVKDENYKTRYSFMAIDEIEDNFIDINKNRFVNIDKSYELKDNYKEITKDYEGAHKGLASKEIINNKEEVISNSCCSNKEKESKNNILESNNSEDKTQDDVKLDKYNIIKNNCEYKNKEKLELEKYNDTQDNNDFKVDMYTKAVTKINTTTDTTVKSDMVKSCRANFKNIKGVLAIFESNIHKAVPMEEKKIIAWDNRFSYDVIVMAIVNNIKNIGYIEKILNNWFSKGLTSPEDIKVYKAQWTEKNNKAIRKLQKILEHQKV